MVLFGDGIHGLGEYPVDAELDDHGIVTGFDVNITRAALQGGENRGVDQPDDGTHVPLGSQLVNGDALVAALLLVYYVEGETFTGVFENSLRLFGLFEDLGDL